MVGIFSQQHMFWIESLWAIILIWLVTVALVVMSAEWVVERMIKLAHHYNISDTFVGLTILSIWTSLPEIWSHLIASIWILQGTLDYQIASSTVLWANIWSNVVQQTFIIWLVILLVRKMKFKKTFLYENYIAMLITMAIVWTLGYDGFFSQSDWVVLLLLFVIYLYFLYWQEQSHQNHHRHHETHETLTYPWRVMLQVIWWMWVLLACSSVTLSAVQFVVTHTWVSGSLIGVLTLWVASALPELITALAWVRKNADGISLGTLIWSNIINPLVAIGMWAVISSYYVPHPLISWDLPMQMLTALILLRWLLRHKRKLRRPGGVFLIVLYLVYLLIRVSFFGID